MYVKGLVDLSRQGTRNVGFSVPSLDLLVAWALPV